MSTLASPGTTRHNSLMRTLTLVLLCGAVARPVAAQAVPQHVPTTVDFRSSSAASAAAVWLGGSDGTFARTRDGGRTWTVDTIPGASGLFLVGVHAMNADTAYALGTSFSGGSARIYRTNDGGATWELQYSNDTPGIFFDGLTFWDAHRGLAFSDPVNGHLVIVRTEDGEEWSVVSTDSIPPALPGEVGFAASGTAVAVADSADAWIGTGGGATARIYHSTTGGRSWTVSATPLPAGATSGIYAIAFRDALHGVAVGGDYAMPGSTAENVLGTSDGGQSWTLLGTSAPAGARYGIVYVPGTAGTFVAAGPSGWGFSTDHGKTWTAGDLTRYNTVTAWSAAAIWLAGQHGAVARLALPPNTR